MKKNNDKLYKYLATIIISIAISFILLLSFGCSKPLAADNVEEDNNEIAEIRDPFKWPFEAAIKLPLES